MFIAALSAIAKIWGRFCFFLFLKKKLRKMKSLHNEISTTLRHEFFEAVVS